MEDEKNQERLVSKCWLEKKPLDIFAISKLLKKLLVSLEDRGIEASADIYKTFNRSRLPPDSQYGWRYYTLHDGRVLPFYHSRGVLLQSGTTGLCSWPAAWCLAEFAISDVGQSIFRGASLLELGCGTGVGGIFTAALLRDNKNSLDAERKLFLTDVHNDVLAVAQINADAAKEAKLHTEVHELDWCSYDRRKLEELLDQTDIVCGADIFFEPCLFPDLTKLLHDCLTYKPCVRIILAATMRNEETWRKFLEECKGKKLRVAALGNCLDLEEYFVYERSSILIVEVSLE